MELVIYHAPQVIERAYAPVRRGLRMLALEEPHDVTAISTNAPSSRNS